MVAMEKKSEIQTRRQEEEKGEGYGGGGSLCLELLGLPVINQAAVLLQLMLLCSEQLDSLKVEHALDSLALDYLFCLYHCTPEFGAPLCEHIGDKHVGRDGTSSNSSESGVVEPGEDDASNDDVDGGGDEAEGYQVHEALQRVEG